MAADLKINVSADTASAVAGLKALTVELNAQAPAVLKTGQAFESLAFEQAALTQSARNYGSASAIVTQNATRQAAAIHEVAIAQAEANVTQEAATIGSNGLLNTLAKQRVAFQDVGRVITGQGFSLRSLSSNFALFGPQVVIAAAAIGYLVKSLLQASSAEEENQNKIKEITDRNDELAKSIKDVSIASKEAEASEAGNIAKVKDLAAAVVDSNLSYKERNKALTELKEINKAYFGDLTLETATYSKLTGLVKEYSKAIINQAITKKFSSDIADTAKAIADADDNTAKARNKWTQALESQARAEANLKAVQSAGRSKEEIEAFGPGGKTNSTGYNLDIVNALTQRDAAIRKVNESEKILRDTQKTYTDLTVQRVNQEHLLNAAILEGLKLKGTKTEKAPADETNKETSSIRAQISALESLHKEGNATRVDLEKLASLKLKLIDLELPKTKLSEGQANGLRNDIEVKLNEALKAKQVVAIIDAKLDIKKLEVTIDTNKAAEAAKAAGKGAAEVIDLSLAKGAGQVDIGAAFNGVLKKNLIAGIENVSQAVGQAIVSGDFSGVLASFESSIGQLIIDFGKSLVESALEIQTLKAVAEDAFINPAVAIVAGAAAIAIGSALKAKASEKKSPKMFAEGGLVTGPTNAIIGEAGPEVVFPLNKINQFIKGLNGGGGSTVNVTGRLVGHGRELHAVLQAENKSNVRLGGRVF